MRFEDRHAAGQVLARELERYKEREDVVVLGLPRGGVPVAYEVAKALNAPLDVFLVRKLGVPGHEELAMGAIATGGVQVLNEDVVANLPDAQKAIREVAERELRELERREKSYRGDRPPHDFAGKVAILVDDGLATGASMKAAAAALRKLGPQTIIAAVPVGAYQACRDLSHMVDEVACALIPDQFYGVGQWYDDFSQTTDDEVKELLALAPSSRS